ncbi:UNVERIFIED_CONTAM: putative pectinesterase/pectinesterase inhibitor 58 [Sesamum calycinum]|uniref:Pectinesterase/pectinesterase inhibitor 58 n=1 Tax=Sesamum calycinum TaxID=2727403 RepID=A0AAW2QKM5_9LAMI
MAAKAAVAGLAAILVVAMVVAVAVGVTRKQTSDDSTKQALDLSRSARHSIDDLKRSFDKVGEFDASKANEYLEDLKTWLSAVITNHETCIDAFEKPGDTGEKMKNVLQTARQMSSNGLAMVSNMSSIFTSLQTGSAASRKLLSEEEADLFISKKQRSLLHCAECGGGQRWKRAVQDD